MNEHDKPELTVLIVLGALVLAMLIPATVFSVQSARVSQRCLEAGYPGSQVAWNLDAYCVKRIDQTDVVVPLDEVVK